MDYPQWLLPTFIRSARAAGATASDEELSAAAMRLMGRWGAPNRHHHGLHHLCDMLSRITTLAPETHHPELVSLAAFYHGCVFSTADKDTYTRNGGENEVESARVARSELTAIGIAPATVDRVADLITGMKKQPREIDPTISTTLNAIDIDKLALRDAHLGALAAGPQKYTKYLDQVSKEYSHVPQEAFLRARREIIGKLLARRQIFLTPLGRQWEGPARDNLAGELERIETRLAALHDERSAEEAAPLPRGEERPLSPEEYAKLRQGNERVVEEIASPDSLPPAAKKESDRSSLETIPDDSEPGSPPRTLTTEKKKMAEREEIARKMQERMARRQRGLPGESIATPPSPIASPPSAPSQASPPSAPTPEWHDDDDSARAGFEREPDY
ncbi:HD domain-containing protein [Flaviflexus equikiangi]|uniref:Metal-dependent phosphohydrolase n=1 Tax=Flaviflexus equikiangi TaxID=2758573 RepID=A0ABS2TCR5_9ACTO|nr:hypothetical protein [Flaviflexus equikiangi]MBM9432439.1 hypothetical protein [Flaviflexus equikiangi]